MNLARSLRVGTTAAALSVREGNIDIACNKPTTSLSVAYGGASARALDGNTGGVGTAGSVTHTNDEAPAPHERCHVTELTWVRGDRRRQRGLDVSVASRKTRKSDEPPGSSLRLSSVGARGFGERSPERAAFHA